MRTRLLVLTVLAVAGVLLFLRQPPTEASQVVTNPQPTPAAGDLQAITLIFGSKDPTVAKWDGSIALSSGKIEQVRGWHFGGDDKVTGTAWACSTHPWSPFS